MGCGSSKNVAVRPEPTRESQAAAGRSTGQAQARTEQQQPAKARPTTPPKPDQPFVTPRKGILIFGAPASGKGTQCERLVEQLHVAHISTGDLLRDQVSRGTALGKKAGPLMEAGKLVPDEILMGMVGERLSQKDVADNGYLLDGFPRTKPQAEELVRMGAIGSDFSIIVLDVPDDTLVERVAGRRIDPETQQVYHVKFNPPPAGEIASRVIQRSDDTEEKLRVRLASYHKNLEGILSVFHGRDAQRFDGTKRPDQVAAAIKAFMAGRYDAYLKEEREREEKEKERKEKESRKEREKVTFAVSLDVDMETAQKKLKATRARLGIALADAADIGDEGEAQQEGTTVTNTSDGGPAELAGLKEEDVIVSVDGGKVFDESDFKLLMKEACAGQVVVMSVLRAKPGKQARVPIDVSVTFGAPDMTAEEVAALRSAAGDDFCAELDAERKARQQAHLAQSLLRRTPPRLGLAVKMTEVGYRGAMVSALEPKGPAEDSGFKIGDVVIAVEGMDVPDNQVFRSLLILSTAGESVDITVLRVGVKTELALAIGAKGMSLDQVRDTRKTAGDDFCAKLDQTQRKKRKMVGEMLRRTDEAAKKEKEEKERERESEEKEEREEREEREKREKKKEERQKAARSLRRQQTVADLPSRAPKPKSKAQRDREREEKREKERAGSGGGRGRGMRRQKTMGDIRASRAGKQ